MVATARLSCPLSVTLEADVQSPGKTVWTSMLLSTMPSCPLIETGVPSGRVTGGVGAFRPTRPRGRRGVLAPVGRLPGWFVPPARGGPGALVPEGGRAATARRVV